MRTIILIIFLFYSANLFAKDVFIQCYDSRIEIIKEAKLNAINLLTNTIETGNNYEKWFKGYNPTIIRNKLKIIKSAIINNDNVYDCSCKKEDFYAGIFRAQEYIIYLCEPFWESPALGIDSQAGIIIHEFSHFIQTVRTIDTMPNFNSSLRLSKFDKAIENANNYEYLCEEN